MNWKGCERNFSWPNLRYSHNVYLDQGKPQKKSDKISSLWADAGRWDFYLAINNSTYLAVKFGHCDSIPSSGRNFPLSRRSEQLWVPPQLVLGPDARVTTNCVPSARPHYFKNDVLFPGQCYQLLRDKTGKSGKQDGATSKS
jgi:hypothetical protein